MSQYSLVNFVIHARLTFRMYNKTLAITTGSGISTPGSLLPSDGAPIIGALGPVFLSASPDPSLLDVL
jgi:hypothetical protein